MPRSTAPTWKDSDPDRYRRHRAKSYTPPRVDGQRPWLLRQADQRLGHLFHRRRGPRAWKVRGIRATHTEHRGATALRTRLGIQALHHHEHLTPSGRRQRRRRDQALHSAELVLRYLLARTNVQRHGPLGWLEVARTSVEEVATATGLSRSAARDGLALLGRAGFIRTAREQVLTEKGRRERPARRYITPHLFAALGLSSLYSRQMSGGRRQRPQPAGAPPHRAPEAPAAEAPHPSEKRPRGAFLAAVGLRPPRRPGGGH